MGNFYCRLLRYVLAYVFLIGSAYAESIPATTGLTVQRWTYGNGLWNNCARPLIDPLLNPFIGKTYASREALAVALDQALPDTNACAGAGHESTIIVQPAGSYQVIVSYRRNGDGMTMFWSVEGTGVPQCPDSTWTLNGNTCSRPDCPPGQDRNSSGQCVKDCTGKAGQLTANGNYQFYGAVSSWQVGGCKVSCPVRSLAAGGGVGQDCRYTGASADPDSREPDLKDRKPDLDPPPEKPDDCLNRGKGYIQSSSGSVTCVSSSDAPPGQKPKNEVDSKKEKGTPGPDGKPNPNSPDYEKNETTSKQNGDGTVSTTEKSTKNGTSDNNGGYSCPDGYVKIGNNQCQKTTSKTENEATFCQENPQSPICKKSSFAGSCETGFSCDGDAATCATSRASWELACALKGDTSSLVDSTSPGGTDQQLADGQKALNKDGEGNFNLAEKYAQNQQAWFAFSSGCPVGVQTFNIMGRTLEIDGSMICDIGVFVRLLVHIVAYMSLIKLFAYKLV